MIHAYLTYALIATFSTALGSPEASLPTRISGSTSCCIKAKMPGPVRSTPRFPLRPARLFATPQLSELDDEIATPDEPEDDRPDRLECAFQGKYHTFEALLFCRIEVPHLATTAPPPRARDASGPEPKRPRFLSLCRLLI